MKERNFNLDLIRFAAIFSVIAIHFIRNIGFYAVNITGFSLSLAVFFRTVLEICVPLFLLLTGYLMNKKQLSKKYYLGIVKVIFVFFSAKIIYLLVDHFYFHEIDSFTTILRHIFSYSDLVYYNDYSWYVNMYFGLFLLIPFFNLIYHNLKSKKEKQVLILTLLFLTSLSSLNIKHITIIPDWWGPVYPITYYFIGAYLSEYKINIKNSYLVIAFVLLNLISSIFYIFISYDKIFVTRDFNDYRGPITFICSVLFFVIVLNLNTKKVPTKIKKFVTKTSEISFGMYLFSFIVDKVFYDKFNSIFSTFDEKFIYGIIVVPLIFMLSFFLSYLIDIIYTKFINPLIKRN